MTTARLTLPATDRSSRWLLLFSLALNLFFIGIGGALLLQGGGAVSNPPATAIDRSVATRIARIAATLPPADADRLRAAYRANRDGIDGTRAAYRRMQDAVRAALRAEPFDVEALRAAMANLRTARQVFDRRLQDFFAVVASDMTPAGRQKLADWRSSAHDTATRRTPAGGDR